MTDPDEDDPERPESPLDRPLRDPDDESDEPDADDATDAEAPLESLAGELSEGELAATEEDLFEREETPEVDREALWRQVADEETAERAIEEMDIDAEETTTDTATAAGGDERVVEKSTYCHVCPHFSNPPEVRCTHEGTEIVEAVDVEHFRVVNCPVVAENEALEEF